MWAYDSILQEDKKKKKDKLETQPRSVLSQQQRVVSRQKQNQTRLKYETEERR